MKESITIRIDNEVLNWVKKMSEAENRTVSNFIETALMYQMKDKSVNPIISSFFKGINEHK